MDMHFCMYRSEHERHSPACPFVKGEYTANVPIAVTYATEPALLHGKSNEKIDCWSTTTSDVFVATSTSDGNVTIWDYSAQFRRYCSFNIDASFVMVAQLLQSPENFSTVNESAEASGADDYQPSTLIADMNDLGACTIHPAVPSVSLIEDILGMFSTIL